MQSMVPKSNFHQCRVNMIFRLLYIILIFFAAILTIGVALYAWRNKEQTGAKLFAGTMLAVSEWLITSGFVSLSQTPDQARWWVDPRYFGLTAMLAFFITFVLQFTGHGKWLTRPRMIFFFSVPIVTQIIIETNAWHHWFLVDVGFSRDGILMGIDSVRYGPAFWLHTIYSYALVLIGIYLIVRRSIRTFRIYRQQAILMILGILPPLLTSVTDAFLLIPGLRQPLAPIGFAVMGICFGFAMFRHKMLEIVPVARDYVIESMSDAMIVLDVHDKVVDFNPAAKQFLKLNSSQILGQPIGAVFPGWHDLLLQSQEPNGDDSEICVGCDGEEKVFDARVSPLKTHHTNQSGKIVILRDITQRKQAEIKLKLLQEKFYEQSIRDPLTGLYNRRFFTESIRREAEKAKREGQPICIAIIDIDYFKQVNDTYGHEAGDMALIHLAGLLSKLTRAGDYVFRYGGEEFLIMLPDTSLQAGTQFAERCRKYVEKSSLLYADQQIKMTVSIGVAVYQADEENPDRVLKLADAALYEAKSKDRNCVIVYDQAV